MERLLACIIVVAALALIGGASLAETSADERRYQIFDTKAGVIRMNSATGEACLLDVSGGQSAWRVIQEPELEDSANGPLLVDDVEWILITDQRGAVLGVRVGEFKRVGDFGGLVKDDVIKQIDSKSVESTGDIRRAVADARRAGTEVKFTVTRDGKDVTIASKFPATETPK